jgi:RNA polymerase sigma-70 factor (ECF subfamily)
MSSTDSFGALMTGLRRGDNVAAAEVHGRFVHRLVGLAYKQFDTWARHKADYEDVVQSAFRSFFRRCQGGAFEITNWDALWALLAVITVRKCRDRRKRLGAARRELARERAWDASVQRQQGVALLDGDPTPEQAAMLAETVREWLGSLNTAERAVVELGLMGHDDAEVARRLLRSRRTVRRVRSQVEQRLYALCFS